MTNKAVHKPFGSKWGSRIDPNKRVSVVVSGPPVRRTQALPATRGHFDNTVAAKVEPQQYTGTEVVGIAVMHKSCLQPVFSEDAAKDSAKMRRG